MGIGLAVVLLLLAAGEARAGKYAVAQCGWYVGADADWADTTGGAKFRSDGYCVPPAGADPFDGAHLKSLTRDGQGTVSGTRYARWRWVAPAGTGITQVRGTWWHALHDGLEQRIGAGNWSGGFDPFLTASSTDVTPRDFVAGFPSPVPAIEDRLLCARGEDKWCSLDSGSWSGLRALTITVEDDLVPAVGIGGDLIAGGWRHGTQSAAFWSADGGSGLRFGETLMDGARVGFTEFSCAKASIGGEWRATQMRPCATEVATGHAVATTNFSDGTHTAANCAVDFAGNAQCTSSYPVQIDNNPPVHPRSLAVAGGESWHRIDDFDFSWVNPDQGPASPIAGAYWHITGASGYDSGVKLATGRDLTSLPDRSVPAAGVYTLHLWLRDEAGNDSPSTALELPIRFDDVPPGLAFAVNAGEGIPDQIVAEVNDAHSGPASGTIFYRRLGVDDWTELPTKLLSENGTKASLTARTPELAPGTYVFRAEAADAASNTAATSLRADGTEMAFRKLPPPVAPARVVPPHDNESRPPGHPRAKTRLFARLRGGHGRGDSLTVPFAAPALVSGRLTRADGAGVAGRPVRIVSRPSRGALAPVATETVTTGERGGYELRLAPGPSRRVAVSFAGDDGLEAARRPSLELRVRSAVSLRVTPAVLRTGQTLRLSGRVRSRGAPVPRRGKLVAIQYLEAATHRWRPVLVTRTDHHGRFRTHYRFRYVSGVASIRLRATALAEERWPYAPGSSRPVTVRVSGR
ncbi:MAG TPA: carboxypeptidase-like regulatory domain-containing protein [Solirubrobacterales bacterium]|jgi:hypothetical protein|nr:carboxypeptidase-like regulatory domain-containing protein [Solirubrobacterales bacterium]